MYYHNLKIEKYMNCWYGINIYYNECGERNNVEKYFLFITELYFLYSFFFLS